MVERGPPPRSVGSRSPGQASSAARCPASRPSRSRNAPLEPPPIGDFSWPEAGSTLPTVASPSFSYEPAYSDNHVREGDPKFDDPIPALSTPHELLVGVLPGVCALHDPAFCACQRSRFPFLGDPRDQATGL